MEGIKECLLVGSWRPISFLESLEDIYEEKKSRLSMDMKMGQ